MPSPSNMFSVGSSGSAVGGIAFFAMSIDIPEQRERQEMARASTASTPFLQGVIADDGAAALARAADGTSARPEAPNTQLFTPWTCRDALRLEVS